MVSGALVESARWRCQVVGCGLAGRGSIPVARVRIAIMTTIAAAAAIVAGCETRPKPPPGARPSVEVGAPLRSEAWKSVATAADEDRLARLGLAWQQALDDAKKSNAGDVRREGKLLLPRSALPRPDPTPGSYNCRLIKLGQATPRGKPY